MGFSLLKPRFNPRAPVADEVELGHIFSEYFSFPPQTVIPPMLHTHLSPRISTTGPCEATVPRVLLHPTPTTNKQGLVTYVVTLKHLLNKENMVALHALKVCTFTTLVLNIRRVLTKQRQIHLLPLWMPLWPVHASADAPDDHSAAAPHTIKSESLPAVQDVAHCGSPTWCTSLASVLTEHRPFCGSCANKHWNNSTKQIQSYAGIYTYINKQIIKMSSEKLEPNQKAFTCFSPVSLYKMSHPGENHVLIFTDKTASNLFCCMFMTVNDLQS